MQAPVRQVSDAQAERRQREAAMAALAAALRAELAKSGAGTWDRWMQRLEPVRAEWKAGGRRYGEGAQRLHLQQERASAI